MQTNKARNGSSEVPHKTSPITPKSSHGSKASGSESDSVNSKLTPKKASTAKTMERRSPRSPAIERKRPIRMNELETEITHLQEELKKTKDQLSSSESSKKRLQSEAEEAKKQLATVSAKFEKSQQQLVEFTEAENTRLQELRKISQERDKEWQSELEALQKQHLVDSVTLGSAMNEIQRLKQCEAAQAKDSERTQSELDTLKDDLAVTLSIVEKLKIQTVESGKAEDEAKLMVSETQKQLEIAHSTIASLCAKGSNLEEALNSTISKLEESRVRVSALEELVKELQGLVEGDEDGREVHHAIGASESELENINMRERELESLLNNKETEFQILSEMNKQLQEKIEKCKAKQLDSELEQLRSENADVRECELESTLQRLSAELSDSKVLLIDKDTELQSFSEMNKQLKEEIEKCKANEFDLGMKLMKVNTFVTELKSNLMDKETELQNLLEENEQLTLKLSMKESEHQKKYAEVVSEADKNGKKVTNFIEQLEAAKSMNSEMEAELRRLRVQSDQWRKAAEAAAAVLTPGSNLRAGERTGSLDSDFNLISGKLMSSPFSDDLDDESPKKKNSNVLKKIGGLWKKGPK
ncbi:Interactor of constitutive active ROPs 2, chloroplastic [Apostasia shenzhenica]|uniref:Interactor of constitutive active ROPs 2, chloroplastic n=1 Tax=Apostasia shenzhenica TaxID=1088818 RepID=A0A2I0B4D0_9ASPA|nr:Interactor of constitutive active ROPs 2, chloroplastic [Apostasia shenzhenica]